MKPIALLAVAIVALSTFAAEGVYMPWDEFESLYRERIEREVLMETAQPVRKPQIVSIDETRYRLTLLGEETQGHALISGKVVAGEPEAIPLFGPDLIITELIDVKGGVILSSTEANRTSFLPEAAAQEFQLIISFLVLPRDDDDARVVSFTIPQALQNSVALTLEPEARLLEHPGIMDPEGVYHFAASQQLTVKYIDPRRAGAAAIVEIDTISRVSVQKNRIFINSLFQPARPLPETVHLRAPAGARLISSSLQASRLRQSHNGRYELTFPSSDSGAFSVDFMLDGLTDDGQITFLLPTIEGNNGQQGRFVVDEPDDAQVSVEAARLVTQIPVERLGQILGAFVPESRFYSSVPAEETINVTVQRFQSVSTPATVLDTQYFFTSFEENGDILSVLVMDVPPEVGARLKLNAVPGAEIWSLTVNGAKGDVYADQDNTWIIPLESGKPSHVELAFLRQGPKIALQGKLDALVPATGLPARDLRVGLALPERVELLFLEGPVNPAQEQDWILPTDFSGKRYFFSRSFHKGEGMTLSVSYKEPVNHAQGQ